MSGPSDDQSTTSGQRGSLKFLIIGLAVLVIAGVVGAAFFLKEEPDPDQLARTARIAFRRGKYKEALEAAEAAHEAAPTNKLVLIAGESAQKMGDLDSAMAWYRRLEDDGGDEYQNGAVAQALLCLNTGRLTEADKWFGIALSNEPRRTELNRWYGTLLNAEGRRWEANKYFFRAAQLAIANSISNRGAFLDNSTMDDIFMLANFEAPFEDIPIAEKAAKAMPDDPIALLGRVQKKFVFNKYDEAIVDLRKIIDKHPSLLQAHTWLGRGLLDSGALDQMPAWAAALPADHDSFAPLWHIKGLWAAKRGQNKAAARCYWEAVRREPDFGSANYQLGLTLVALKQPDNAKPFLERHTKLSGYHQLTHPMYTSGPQVKTLQQVMDITGELGRKWEQIGWCNFLIRQAQQERKPPEEQQKIFAAYQELVQQVASNPPRTLTAANPARTLDLSSYPLPDWSKSGFGNVQQTATDASTIRFEDIASDIGLEFTYTNGADQKKGLRIFEGTGGGVAALDFDLDGWSDLYLTQGSEWPVNKTEPGKRDQLFRSIDGGTRVEKVTAEAGLGDADYSQGVTVGDINSDGFPDLYIGNLGQNRLYHNNGDGTFTEVSSQIQGRSNRWTTSVLAADLNTDGLVDLFDANYLSGDKVFELMCGEVQRVCAPAAYTGEHCDIYLNDGAGGFKSASESTGLTKRIGKSLGIIAGDLDNSGQLSLFVSNDGIANFLFVPQGDGDDLKFDEQALNRGIAFDYDSSGQACMGITADDFDGDEMPDFFVTNYYEESNTLYKMLAGNLFVDHSREAQLRTPSFMFLGWGTQSIDANLDGWPDLVVTNGHVDDFTHAKIPFRMRPQFFQNNGGQFSEVEPTAESEFMNQQQLGRGLARLDIDRDGRMDFAVNHLDTPASVARNVTADAGHFLTVHLVGIESTRDPIGASVTVQTADRKRTIQLFAGDGFQACNQRVLNFGLDNAGKIERMIVQWPSGVRQTFTDVPIDNEIKIRENVGSLYALPK